MSSNDQAKVILHWLSGSRSQRILWLLIELGVPYELDIYLRDPQSKLAPPELKKIHPLGKSPVVTIVPAGGADPIVLPESGLITEYLVDHFGHGKNLVPPKWQKGKEGQPAGETAAWLRYKYLLHYAEGTLMPFLLIWFMLYNIKGPRVPFFIRPITALVANAANNIYTYPNMRSNMQLLESFLAEPPAGSDGQGYMCGGTLSAADILLTYPLLALRQRAPEVGAWEGGSVEKEFPLLFAYLERLESLPGYKKAVAEIVAKEGYYTVMPEGMPNETRIKN